MFKRLSNYSVLALVTVLALLAAACGGGGEKATPAPSPTAAPPPRATATPIATPTPTSAPTPATDKPIRGGIFHDRINQDITRGLSWDAHQMGGIVQIRVVPNIMSGVLRTDKFDAGKILPDLAQSWSVSDDGTALTLKFAPGVTYHDGQPFKASDVVWSYNRR